MRTLHGLATSDRPLQSARAVPHLPPTIDSDPRAIAAQSAVVCARIAAAAEARNEIRILSMGMTADYEVAVAFGATHVRLGTAIFGERTMRPSSA